MKRVVMAVAGLLALTGPMWQVQAQVAPPVATVVFAPRSPEQLEQLLGPVALYPDPLIAQILPAATLPSQLVMASRYVQQGMGLDVIDQQPWDPSVKGLARHPDLLRWMDTNLAWTTDVGQSYIYQQAAVLNAIQRLRQQAIAMGNLQSTPQQVVYSNNGIIEVVPANPQVVYVPVFQPTVVYTQPAPRPGINISFGIGVATGKWFNHDVDWHDHRVVQWRRDNPRPSNWWYHGGDDRNRVTVVNNTTIINNRNSDRDVRWPTHREPAPVVRSPRSEPRVVQKPQPLPRPQPGRPPEPRWSSGSREHERGGGRPVASVGNTRPGANKISPAPQGRAQADNSKMDRERRPGRFS